MAPKQRAVYKGNEGKSPPPPSRRPGGGNRDNTWAKATKPLFTAAGLLVLAAAYSPISQLSLSPVYGSVPAGVYHRRGMVVTALCSWLARDWLKRRLPSWAIKILPVLAFTIPTIQFFLNKQSSTLGNPYGPLVTEVLTYYPLLLLSLHAASAFLDRLPLEQYGNSIAEHAPVIGTYALFNSAEKLATGLLPNILGTDFFTSRIGLQYVAAALYAFTIPSKFVLFSIPALLLSALSNVHLPFEQPTTMLNLALAKEGYVLIDRQDSLTGYVSVLQNVRANFRVMRCDHSLLGGEWTMEPVGYVPKVKEPIYSVFVMLEAVRLVAIEGAKPKVDSDSNALVIGLGIGTTPAALITHGINTTVVEIDPVVYDMATKYFHLPENHTAVIQDAVTYVNDAQGKMYDYIVHDVFTGGAEPVDLFTQEFLQGLSSLLKEDGVIAINYAGDLTLGSAGIVIRTIQTVFPSCRIFREDEAPADPSESDFTNMVIFCQKTATPIGFRKPVKADFLDSKVREYALVPKYEIDQSVFNSDGRTDILKKGETDELVGLQTQSAIGHWKVMRTVMPDAVWENW